MTNISFMSNEHDPFLSKARPSKGSLERKNSLEEAQNRVSGFNGIKNGAHNPSMEKLINAFEEKEKLFQEVRKIVQTFQYS